MKTKETRYLNHSSKKSNNIILDPIVRFFSINLSLNPLNCNKDHIFKGVLVAMWVLIVSSGCVRAIDKDVDNKPENGFNIGGL